MVTELWVERTWRNKGGGGKVVTLMNEIFFGSVI